MSKKWACTLTSEQLANMQQHGRKQTRVDEEMAKLKRRMLSMTNILERLEKEFAKFYEEIHDPHHIRSKTVPTLVLQRPLPK